MINNYFHTFLILFGFLNVLLTLITFSFLRKIAQTPRMVVVQKREHIIAQSRIR